jgi:hypothetical protein
MRIKTFLVVIFLMVAAQAFATTYYIDYTAGADTNNGTAKETPWKRCPGMKGFAGTYSHSNGNVFIFKGGETWAAAAFPMTVYGGSLGSITTYTVDNTWYTGASWTQPIFDGGGANTALIFHTARVSYVKIDNIKFTNIGITGETATASPIKISDMGDGIEISNNTIAAYANHGIVLGHSCVINRSGLKIHHNTFQHCTNHIEIGGGCTGATYNDIEIYNNVFEDPQTQLVDLDHADGIHIWNVSNTAIYTGIKIYNNIYRGDWGSGDGSTTSTAQIYLEDCCSGVDIYNNVLSFTNTTNSYSGFLFTPGFIAIYGSSNVRVYNNTVTAAAIPGKLSPSPAGGKCGVVISAGGAASCDNIKIKNNIFQDVLFGVGLPTSGCTTGLEIDYNQYHIASGEYAGGIGGSFKSFAQWQASGYEAHGQSGDPLFTDIVAPTFDLTLQEASPSVNKGVDLSASFTTDLLGNARPTGANSWDMGAYERGGTADETPPIISSATINTDGDTLTLVFDEVVTVNTSTGFTLGMSGGAAGLTYTSGSGTNTLVYAITGRNIDTAETGTLDYASVANGIEDAAGNDLASTGESDEAVTNDSEYTPSATTYIVTVQSGGDCIISPFISKIIVSGEAASYTCTANGNSGCAAWTGTCGGTGTTSFTSSAVKGDCTVIQGCYKIAPDATIGSGAAVTLGSGAVGTLY